MLPNSSAADTALATYASRSLSGGPAASSDRPTPPPLPPTADVVTAGGAVNPSFPPVGPPVSDTSADREPVADGRELLSPDDVFAVLDLEGSWARLRTAARVFAEVQQARKRISNQISLVRSDGTVRKDADRRRAPLPERDDILSAVDVAEKAARKTLRIHWRGVAGHGPFAQLADETPGLSWFSIARLLGETGHPVMAQPFRWESTPGGTEDRVLVPEPLFVRSQRQWLSYCGYGDPDRRRRTGMSQTELFACGSTRAKTAAWLIATTGFRAASGKTTKAGLTMPEWPWRSLWDETRAGYDATHPDWKPWRRKAAADRVMTKAVLVAIYRAAWDDVMWRRDLEVAA